MTRRTRSLGLLAVVALALAEAGRCWGGFVVFSAGGDNTAASIQPTVDTFRDALGSPNQGNAAGPLGFGRREINWDGGGAMVASSAGTLFSTFQDSRGATFTTPGMGFLQTPLDVPELTSINSTYTNTFQFFSPVRILVPLGSNIMDVTFAIPGSGGMILAGVSGFGAVFTDVDLLSATTLELFGSGDESLGLFNVAPGAVSDGSLSFLGLIANAGELITRVRITTGTTALGPNDDPANGVDIVGLDDFLFAEPRALAVPEPAGAVLFGWGGVVGLILVRRRRSECGAKALTR